MRLIIAAKRWDSPVDSKEYDEPITEIRLVQREDGNWNVFTNGSDKPAIAIEPRYDEYGERVHLFGDNEEVDVSKL